MLKTSSVEDTGRCNEIISVLCQKSVDFPLNNAFFFLRENVLFSFLQDTHIKVYNELLNTVYYMCKQNRKDLHAIDEEVLAKI